MKPSTEIRTLFLDIGGVLLTDGWDHHARKRAAKHFKLEWAEIEPRHQLTFDTYEEGTDVTDATDQIYDLLYLDPSTHAPPICELTWGTFSFCGVLDHVSGRFTLFLADGTPVRATLSVVFNEFIDVDVLVQENPTESADHRKTRLVKSGDRIDNIAAEEYGDPAKWRAIAEANDLDDPSQLEPGYVLIVPRLP